eukprot:scaffold58491_cov22-Cyclotella_meneghiniana.AAC.1
MAAAFCSPSYASSESNAVPCGEYYVFRYPNTRHTVALLHPAGSNSVQSIKYGLYNLEIRCGLAVDMILIPRKASAFSCIRGLY